MACRFDRQLHVRAETGSLTDGMARIRTHIDIDAPTPVVWRAIEHVESHVEWMNDAVAIRLTGRKRHGVGTTFECDTRVGPFRLTDLMEVTEWDERRRMGIRHVGLVTGTGRFTLDGRRHGRTRFTWEERLTFPLWMGAWPGSVAGAVVLRRVWRRNLHNLKARVEGSAGIPRSLNARRWL